jgi:histidine ammonia-lyase
VALEKCQKRSSVESCSPRLNSILFGSTGARPRVAELYRDFLNQDLVPVVPERGSVGEADITLISHIGLAMMGEWKVDYRGKRMSAKVALKKAGLKPLVPVAKDTLSILSANAYSETLGAFALEELKQVLLAAKHVFALSLEALNGNVKPFLKDVNSIRPFPYVNRVSADLRGILAGSYLWDEYQLTDCNDLTSDYLRAVLKDRSDEAVAAFQKRLDANYAGLHRCQRPLQDPLSFRTGAYTLAAVERTIQSLEQYLAIQLNSSDDNPGIVLNVDSPSERYSEKSNYLQDGVVRGAVIPSANFSPLPWVLGFQESGLALAHLSVASTERTIRLSDPAFTKLSRFLGTANTVHAYGAVQKVFADLAAENRSLANPVSMDTYPVAANIEDMATNGPAVIRRVRRMIDNQFFIMGLELMHASQALDLRFGTGTKPLMADRTREFYEGFREEVDFMDKDRILSPDIQAAHDYLVDFKIP